MTDISPGARALARALEPFTGQVYFSPECHRRYQALGFEGSPRKRGDVEQPDGVAYFCSRGALLGQVPGEVIAAAFGVFNPAVVVPAVQHGWTLVDAATIGDARTEGATDQLRRILGAAPEGVDRACELLRRATDGLRPEGKPLFAGVVAQGLPGDPLGDAWRLADRLREFRGDVHINAWTLAGLDAVEIGLLTEPYWGLPMRTYVRSRAWTPEDLDAGEDRLTARGLISDGALTERGREEREAIEVATDEACAPVVRALGDDLDELVDLLGGWSAAICAAGGYPRHSPLIDPR
jgi:hypothetical protein